MSFINLMADDCWSEADIVNRTEAMIASVFPASEQVILNRKVTAAAIGAYTLTTAEQDEVAQFNALCMQARQAGLDARADMTLLTQALACEAGTTTDVPQAVHDLVAQRAANRAATAANQ